MKPTKAYIIVIDDLKSIQYGALCAKTCKDAGVEYEIVQGIQNKTVEEAFATVDPNYRVHQLSMDPKAACATATHYMLWHKIAQNRECAIILEHDAILYHKVDIDIPHDMIVALGYKYKNPKQYDHQKAGPSTKIVPIGMHSGAHAYAITHITAMKLIDEIENIGVCVAIDNWCFMRNFPEFSTQIPLGLVDPISAMGWVRDSTIWEDEPASYNYTYTVSFITNTKSMDDLNKTE